MPPMPLSHVPDGLGYLAFSVVDADGSAVYVGLNPYPTLVNATLPSPPAGHTWLRAVDSGLAAPLDAAIGEMVEVEGGSYVVNGKSVIVLVAGVVDHLR